MRLPGGENDFFVPDNKVADKQAAGWILSPGGGGGTGSGSGSGNNGNNNIGPGGQPVTYINIYDGKGGVQAIPEPAKNAGAEGIGNRSGSPSQGERVCRFNGLW